MDHSLLTPQNKLLGTLPPAELQNILVNLKLVPLHYGEILYESGEKTQAIYFPLDCSISLLYETEDGSSLEIASVGNEGAVGVDIFMSGKGMPHVARVQNKGHALRMRSTLLMQEFSRYGSLHHKLLSYTQVLMTHIAQMAVCNRFHKIDQQLCRFLLLSFDRLSTNDMVMTQQSISDMLGVRREGITQISRKLQLEGLIRYSRGHIHISNRAGLEARCCECYHIVKSASKRLLAA